MAYHVKLQDIINLKLELEAQGSQRKGKTKVGLSGSIRTTRGSAQRAGAKSKFLMLIHEGRL